MCGAIRSLLYGDSSWFNCWIYYCKTPMNTSNPSGYLLDINSYHYGVWLRLRCVGFVLYSEIMKLWLRIEPSRWNLNEGSLYHVILLCIVEINDVMWDVIINPGETFRNNIAPESCFTTVCRDTNLHTYLSIIFIDYRQTSNVRRTIVGNDTVNHSDVVGASPVGAAPTTYSF